MKNALVLTCALIASLAAFENTNFAQTPDKICTCEKVGNRTCTGEVKCTKGCSAICGKKDTCYLSCSKDIIGKKITVDFVQKTAAEMAQTLATGARLRISFTSDLGRENERYDYKLIDSGVWKLLEFLDVRGTVVVNGLSFERLLELKKEIKDGGKIAGVTFNNISVEEAVLQLQIMTGEGLEIVSGDRKRRVSISAEDVSLTEILEAIKEKSGVQVAIVT